uniref:Uncharacterized protein n=1 Tax=Syphacia muris TaxID=451379 RepID=A0A0N5AV10_9BILA
MFSTFFYTVNISVNKPPRMADSSVSAGSVITLSKNDRNNVFHRSIRDSASKFALTLKHKLTSLERVVRRRNRFSNLDDDSQMFADEDEQFIGYGEDELAVEGDENDEDLFRQENERNSSAVDVLKRATSPASQTATFISGAVKKQKEVNRLLAKQLARCRVWQAQRPGILIMRKKNKCSNQRVESARLLDDDDDEVINALFLKDDLQ